MLTATVSHSRFGYRLEVASAPLWALVAEEVADALCARLGDPLCSGIGPSGFGRRLGQRLLSPACRRSRRLWSAPLTTEEVRIVSPWSLITLDE